MYSSSGFILYIMYLKRTPGSNRPMRKMLRHSHFAMILNVVFNILFSFLQVSLSVFIGTFLAMIPLIIVDFVGLELSEKAFCVSIIISSFGLLCASPLSGQFKNISFNPLTAGAAYIRIFIFY